MSRLDVSWITGNLNQISTELFEEEERRLCKMKWRRRTGQESNVQKHVINEFHKNVRVMRCIVCQQRKVLFCSISLGSI